jgi:type II secretory pathway component GspD/PulD (secretin)
METHDFETAYCTRKQGTESLPSPHPLASWAVVFWCLLFAWQSPSQQDDRQGPKGERGFGEPISLSLRDADLAETLRNFARLGHFNLILDSTISGKVTVELKNVPWDLALEQILKVHGLGMEISSGQLRIASLQDLQQAHAERQRLLKAMRTVRLNLKHAKVIAVADCLRHEDTGILTEEGTAETRAISNTLILHDRAARLLKIGRLLVLLDIPEAALEEPDHLHVRCLNQWAAIQSPKQNLDSSGSKDVRKN